MLPPAKTKPIPKSRRFSDDLKKENFEPRNTDITKPSHPCNGQGHDFIFQRDDRYGYCPRCGDEVLV